MSESSPTMVNPASAQNTSYPPAPPPSSSPIPSSPAMIHHRPQQATVAFKSSSTDLRSHSPLSGGPEALGSANRNNNIPTTTATPQNSAYTFLPKSSAPRVPAAGPSAGSASANLSNIPNPYPSPSSASSLSAPKVRARKSSYTSSSFSSPPALSTAGPVIIQQTFGQHQQTAHPSHIPGPTAQTQVSSIHSQQAPPPTAAAAAQQQQQPPPPPAILSRKFVARRISEGETGRLKEELKCQACGKGYKHISSLAKHLWEHTPEWRMTSKLLISKHQQVQLLEAASILVSINEPDEGEPESSSASPSPNFLGSPNNGALAAGSARIDGVLSTPSSSSSSSPSAIPNPTMSPSLYPQYLHKPSSPSITSTSTSTSASTTTTYNKGHSSSVSPSSTNNGPTPSPSPQLQSFQLRLHNGQISSLSSSLAASSISSSPRTQPGPVTTRSANLSSPPPPDLILPGSALAASAKTTDGSSGSFITDSLYPMVDDTSASQALATNSSTPSITTVHAGYIQKKKRGGSIAVAHTKTEPPAALHHATTAARTRRYSTSTAAQATAAAAVAVAVRRATQGSSSSSSSVASSGMSSSSSPSVNIPGAKTATNSRASTDIVSGQTSSSLSHTPPPPSFSSYLGVFRTTPNPATVTGSLPSSSPISSSMVSGSSPASSSLSSSYSGRGTGPRQRRPSALDPPLRVSTRSTLDDVRRHRRPGQNHSAHRHGATTGPYRSGGSGNSSTHSGSFSGSPAVNYGAGSPHMSLGGASTGGFVETSNGTANGTTRQANCGSNSPQSDPDQPGLEDEEDSQDEDVMTERAIADDQGVFGDMDC